ncbi:MAG: hypothetical protein IPP29_19530 [Bacteroidetes bacterium]|nr:hypothetical protein [Bacteroidota bacterium]
MLKDIKIEEVENIAIAAVPIVNENLYTEWQVHLINLKNTPITGVIVSSQGYGNRNGEEVKTSQLRHLIDTVEPQSHILIEPMIDDVVTLNNEYWVSFYVGEKIYDKKYLFVQESIRPEFLTQVPVINKKGIMIR